MNQEQAFHCCELQRRVKSGHYRRRSDGRRVQRFRCQSCKKGWSQAVFDTAYYQKKRHLNYKVMMLLCSSVSMRRSGLILSIDKKTVARKLSYLGKISREILAEIATQMKKIEAIQFDELITIEHTKCKPLAVAMAVTADTRKILGFQVSSMPATGHLAAISRRKYGPRDDNRLHGMALLFEQLQSVAAPNCKLISDQCPYYEGVVNRYFPKSKYTQYKGAKGALTGQGELKKTRRDPLFAINHSFAMLRANINRLVRRTWCTTKKATSLIDHLSIYAWIHNSKLTPAELKAALA